MKILTIEQRTKEWYEKRSVSIGASDAPIIMGVSPWKTIEELWEEKTGFKKKKNFTSASMQRGIDLEPVSRAMFEIEMDADFPAIMTQHDEYDFLIASLDGYSFKLNAILEIKCPGMKDHALALAQQVPPKYVPQIQHQFLVTGADAGFYVSYDGVRNVVVPIYPDKNYMDIMLGREKKFYELVSTKTRPRTEDFYI